MHTLPLAVAAAAARRLPVLPDDAGVPFAWSLVLSAAVVLISLIPLGAARSQADFKPSDLAAPRAMFDRLPPWGKRAAWAHENCFEAFILHAPACLLCLTVAPGVIASAPWTATLAWLHPALRLLYIAMYLRNIPPVRSLCWIGGLFCTALLYSEGLRAVLRS